MFFMKRFRNLCLSFTGIIKEAGSMSASADRSVYLYIMVRQPEAIQRPPADDIFPCKSIFAVQKELTIYSASH